MLRAEEEEEEERVRRSDSDVEGDNRRGEPLWLPLRLEPREDEEEVVDAVVGIAARESSNDLFLNFL